MIERPTRPIVRRGLIVDDEWAQPASPAAAPCALWPTSSGPEIEVVGVLDKGRERRTLLKELA